ncbi:hypothetical protein B0H17DRAFT_1080174, partial [Mycena rosella]
MFVNLAVLHLIAALAESAVAAPHGMDLTGRQSEAADSKTSAIKAKIAEAKAAIEAGNGSAVLSSLEAAVATHTVDPAVLASIKYVAVTHTFNPSASAALASIKAAAATHTFSPEVSVFLASLKAKFPEPTAA